LFAVGLHTCTAVARSLCVSWAFLLSNAYKRFFVHVFTFLRFLRFFLNFYLNVCYIYVSFSKDIGVARYGTLSDTRGPSTCSGLTFQVLRQ